MVAEYGNLLTYWNIDFPEGNYIRKHTYIKNLISFFNEKKPEYKHKEWKDLITKFKKIEKKELYLYNFRWDKWGRKDVNSWEVINVETNNEEDKEITIYHQKYFEKLEEIYSICESIYLYVLYHEVGFKGLGVFPRGR